MIARPKTPTVEPRSYWNGVTAVDWPPGAHPKDCPVYAYNEIYTTAPPERVWAWLVHAERWPEFYGNAKKVRLPPGVDRLGPDTT